MNLAMSGRPTAASRAETTASNGLEELTSIRSILTFLIGMISLSYLAPADAAATVEVAEMMMSATSLGCATMDAWLAATVRTVAPIRFAMNSSACGGII